MTQSVNLTEYVQAFKPVKRFKNLFLLLILVSVLFQVNSFILLEFTTVLETPKKAQSNENETEGTPIPTDVATPPTTLPATPSATPSAPTTAERYHKALHWALPITKFAALACGVLLVISLMFAGALSLLGRGSGTQQLIGAFFWSVILLGMLIPWQQVYSSSKACGALYSFMDLTQARDLFHLGQQTLADKVFFYGRFLAYPAAAFVVWLIVAFKFAGGYRKLTAAEPKPTSAGM